MGLTLTLEAHEWAVNAWVQNEAGQRLCLLLDSTPRVQLGSSCCGIGLFENNEWGPKETTCYRCDRAYPVFRGASISCWLSDGGEPNEQARKTLERWLYSLQDPLTATLSAGPLQALLMQVLEEFTPYYDATARTIPEEKAIWLRMAQHAAAFEVTVR